MPQLPILSGVAVIKIFKKAGYRVARQRGSHVRLYHSAKPPVTVPTYPTIDRGLLRKILREAGVSAEEFINLD